MNNITVHWYAIMERCALGNKNIHLKSGEGSQDNDIYQVYIYICRTVLAQPPTFFTGSHATRDNM